MNLLEWFAPLKSIATDLHAMRQLYEQDLATRHPDLGGPVILTTEKPKDSDTTVSYSFEDSIKSKPARNEVEKWLYAQNPDYDPEEDETRG